MNTTVNFEDDDPEDMNPPKRRKLAPPSKRPTRTARRPKRKRDEKPLDVEQVPKKPKLIQLSKTVAERAADARDRRERRSDAFFAALPDDYDPPEWVPGEDPDFEIDEVVLFCAQRRGGKTTAATKIGLDRRRLHPVVFCFSNTAENGAWQQILPADKVVNGVDTELIANIIELNTERVRAYCETGKGNPIVLCIFEDPMSDKKKFRNATEFFQIVFDGRHKGIAMWILTQDFVLLGPGQRDSVDRYLLYPSGGPRMRNFVKETWGTKVLDIYNRVTHTPDQILVVVNKNRTPLEKKLFKYKVDNDELKKMLHKNLVMGNTLMWEGIDIKEQKRQWPVLKLKSLATMASKFNETDEDPIEQHAEPVDYDLGVLGGGRVQKIDRDLKKGKESEPEAKLFSYEPGW